MKALKRSGGFTEGWEYRCIPFEAGWYPQTLESKLSGMGTFGWELVSITPVRASASAEIMAVLKRRIYVTTGEVPIERQD